MIRHIKTFEVIFSRNNLSGTHISAMWHSLNVYKYFCPLSVDRSRSLYSSDSLFSPSAKQFTESMGVSLTDISEKCITNVFNKFSTIKYVK